MTIITLKRTKNRIVQRVNGVLYETRKNKKGWRLYKRKKGSGWILVDSGSYGLRGEPRPMSKHYTKQRAINASKRNPKTYVRKDRTPSRFRWQVVKRRKR